MVHEPVQSVARARNTGARHAKGDVLVFVDADVIVPPTLLDTIYSTMSTPTCLGGAVDVYYQPQRLSVKLYLRAWRLVGHLTGMAQGATQFCRKSVFDQVGGYNEKTWIGEDVDFYWDLKRLAKRTNGTVQFIQNPRVRPSCRCFDKWPMWKTLIWTNPFSSRYSDTGRGSGGTGTQMRYGRTKVVGLRNSEPYSTGLEQNIATFHSGSPSRSLLAHHCAPFAPRLR